MQPCETFIAWAVGNNPPPGVENSEGQVPRKQSNLRCYAADAIALKSARQRESDMATNWKRGLSRLLLVLCAYLASLVVAPHMTPLVVAITLLLLVLLIGLWIYRGLTD